MYIYLSHFAILQQYAKCTLKEILLILQKCCLHFSECNIFILIYIVIMIYLFNFSELNIFSTVIFFY